MKNVLFTMSFITIIATGFFPSKASAQPSPGARLFNDGWKFYKGEVTDGENRNLPFLTPAEL